MGHFSIGKLISKSAVSKPATRLYPFEKRQPYANTRGAVVIDITTCIFCSICARKCPTHAIMLSKQEKTWSIDRLKCIACGLCVDVCPKKCLKMANNYSPCVTEKSTETFKGTEQTKPTEK